MCVCVLGGGGRVLFAVECVGTECLQSGVLVFYCSGFTDSDSSNLSNVSPPTLVSYSPPVRDFELSPPSRTSSPVVSAQDGLALGGACCSPGGEAAPALTLGPRKLEFPPCGEEDLTDQSCTKATTNVLSVEQKYPYLTAFLLGPANSAVVDSKRGLAPERGQSERRDSEVTVAFDVQSPTGENDADKGLFLECDQSEGRDRKRRDSEATMESPADKHEAIEENKVVEEPIFLKNAASESPDSVSEKAESSCPEDTADRVSDLTTRKRSLSKEQAEQGQTATPEKPLSPTEVPTKVAKTSVAHRTPTERTFSSIDRRLGVNLALIEEEFESVVEGTKELDEDKISYYQDISLLQDKLERETKEKSDQESCEASSSSKTSVAELVADGEVSAGSSAAPVRQREEQSEGAPEMGGAQLQMHVDGPPLHDPPPQQEQGVSEHARQSPVGPSTKTQDFDTVTTQATIERDLPQVDGPLWTPPGTPKGAQDAPASSEEGHDGEETEECEQESPGAADNAEHRGASAGDGESSTRGSPASRAGEDAQRGPACNREVNTAGAFPSYPSAPLGKHHASLPVSEEDVERTDRHHRETEQPDSGVLAKRLDDLAVFQPRIQDAAQFDSPERSPIPKDLHAIVTGDTSATSGSATEGRDADTGPDNDCIGGEGDATLAAGSGSDGSENAVLGAEQAAEVTPLQTRKRQSPTKSPPQGRPRSKTARLCSSKSRTSVKLRVSTRTDDADLPDSQMDLSEGPAPVPVGPPGADSVAISGSHADLTEKTASPRHDGGGDSEATVGYSENSSAEEMEVNVGPSEASGTPVESMIVVLGVVLANQLLSAGRISLAYLCRGVRALVDYVIEIIVRATASTPLSEEATQPVVVCQEDPRSGEPTPGTSNFPDQTPHMSGSESLGPIEEEKSPSTSSLSLPLKPKKIWGDNWEHSVSFPVKPKKIWGDNWERSVQESDKKPTTESQTTAGVNEPDAEGSSGKSEKEDGKGGGKKSGGGGSGKKSGGKRGVVKSSSRKDNSKSGDRSDNYQTDGPPPQDFPELQGEDFCASVAGETSNTTKTPGVSQQRCFFEMYPIMSRKCGSTTCDIENEEASQRSDSPRQRTPAR